ncbi:hypothetical protein G7067_04930 [Leucobacter insecticola]|uniref:Uncharacterized protein n=1 Tax=Leucobacter insecticola TaxID=2714934 RepID=A0A6G8FHT3_9MICO|nr:hypothetical protein [Leucobacter insecticola]QIM15911.1 hypothetical protein G7067_04930 [Leucobacter insecticola]
MTTDAQTPGQDPVQDQGASALTEPLAQDPAQNPEQDPVQDQGASALTEPLAQDPAQNPEQDPTQPAATAATTATQQVRKTPYRPRPRTGPIVWGALILAFCGYVVQRTLARGDIDATVWITAMTIGLGVLLLAVGGAVLIRNRRH